MKKFYLGLAVVVSLVLSSCVTTTWTATTAKVDNSVCTVSVADLNVGQKVTYIYRTNSSDRRGGVKNCLRAAVSSMLRDNNRADVLVAPEYKYDNSLHTIEVTGYPATYKNFRSTTPVVK